MDGRIAPEPTPEQVAENEYERRLADQSRKLDRIRIFLASDATAISYQSMGQYRSAALKILSD